MRGKGRPPKDKALIRAHRTCRVEQEALDLILSEFGTFQAWVDHCVQENITGIYDQDVDDECKLYTLVE